MAVNGSMSVNLIFSRVMTANIGATENIPPVENNPGETSSGTEDPTTAPTPAPTPPPPAAEQEEDFETCKEKFGLTEDDETVQNAEGNQHPFGTTPEGLAKERAWRASLPQGGDAADDVAANSKQPIPTSCKDLPENPSSDLRISKHITVGMLSNKAYFSNTRPTNLQPNRGLSKKAIACNMRYLAVNCLDPLYDHFKPLGYRIIITSGFRPGGSGSDHGIGAAADLQFYHSDLGGNQMVTGRNLARIIKVINEKLKLPFTQLIFEKDRILHVACRTQQFGGRSATPLFWSIDNGHTRNGQNYRYNVGYEGTPKVI